MKSIVCPDIGSNSRVVAGRSRYNQGHDPTTIPSLPLDVGLMGDLKTLVVVDGPEITTLPVVAVSKFVANMTLTGLTLPGRSVRSVFFYVLHT